MPQKTKSRKQSKLYKKPSKAWREFVEDELQKDVATKTKEKSQNKKKIFNIFKLSFPNKFQIVAILMVIAGLLFLFFRVRNVMVPKYNLTVNVVSMQQDEAVSLNGSTVRIIKEGKTVAGYKLDNSHVARFVLKQGDYNVVMDETFKGSIKVKMNMDRNVELKVNKVTN